MSTNYSLAFWNLENLFDIENAPGRSEKLQRAIGKDVKGRTQAQLDQKIQQLARIIIQINQGRGPDLLGVCEVENEHVLQLLAHVLIPLGRTYSIIHHDTPDERGIDVAFLYDPMLFTFVEQFNHFVMRRTATRDLLQLNLLTRGGRKFSVIGNHWPSRSGGAMESAGYRAVAGETLAYFHQRILEVHGKETPVLAMGDFNDEPSDRSLVDYALSTRSRTKVVYGNSPWFWNLMWAHLAQGLGTLYFESSPNLLDQFLVNENLIKSTSPIQVIPDTVKIERFPEMIKPGRYPSPLPFGGMGKPVNPNGFSDHFPISITMIED